VSQIEYNNFNIEIIHHEKGTSKNIAEKIIGRLYGKPSQIVYQQDNITIHKKIAIAYKSGRHYGYGNVLFIRTIYFACNSNNNTGIEVYIKHKSGQQLPLDVEIMLKKVLCQEIYNAYGIKLTK